MTSWALSMPRSQAEVLAKLRDLADVRVAELGALVWARGTATESELAAVLTRVPSSRFFEIVHEDRLLAPGRLLPTGRLPDVRWVPLREWLMLEIPRPALPGNPVAPAQLRLAPARPRSGEELLLCSADAFRDFMLKSPLHRLRPLRFVVNDRGSEVLVRGRPLPSIPGERFILEAGVATPVGRTWSPAVGASVVRAWLGLRDGRIAVWRRDDGISEVADESFVPASRRAARKL